MSDLKKKKSKKKKTLVAYMKGKAKGTQRTPIYMNPKRMETLKKVGN